MDVQEKKRESKGKSLVHVQLSSSTSSSAHDNSDSHGSHHHSSIPSPVNEPSFPASPSKSGLKFAKSHRSDVSAQGVEYF